MAKVEVRRWDEEDPKRKNGQNTPLGKLEALSWLLDSSIKLPGIRYRVGLDALIGLIPVAGDLIGTALSTYILVMAAKMGVPRVTLLRMGFNVALEALVGLIPFVGDLFDFAWKANRRNVALIRDFLEHPEQARKGDWLFASLFLLFAAGVLTLLGWGAFAIGSTIQTRFATM